MLVPNIDTINVKRIGKETGKIGIDSILAKLFCSTIIEQLSVLFNLIK